MKVRIFSKRFLKPFSDLRPQVWFSKLSTLRLHFAHMRFGKPSSSFNVISNTALILDASLSWLAFIPNNAQTSCYPLRGTPFSNLVRMHTCSLVPKPKTTVISLGTRLVLTQNRVRIYLHGWHGLFPWLWERLMDTT